MIRTVAVVGAGLAGFSSARALRALGFDGRLVMVGAEAHAPYDRPPLSKEFLLGRATVADLALGGPDDALDLEWRPDSPAVRLDSRSRTVALACGKDIRTDGVVLATGAHAQTVPGADGLAGVHTLRTIEDAVALRESLERGGALVVIGAGFIGAEVASCARSLGLDVTIVAARASPLARVLGPDIGQLCAQLPVDHGVRLLTGTAVTGFDGSARVSGVRLANGRIQPADTVVVGVGAAPNVAWLAGSGLETRNGVLTDENYATSIPGVVAVGDCAASYNPYVGSVIRNEHWTNAWEQPVTAAGTLLASEQRARGAGSVPYFWSQQYGVLIQFAGHRREGDTVRIVEGDTAQRSFVAAYERDGGMTAVFAMNRAKPFTRLRRRLADRSPVLVDAVRGVEVPDHEID